jgi:uncharacterized protein YjaG (DUF416 family)
MMDIELKAELHPLGERQRVAFAACCCERVLPAYEAFSRDESWGDARPLREALERIWGAATGEPLQQEQAGELAGRCEEQIHHLDEPFASIFTAPAQDAAIAVVRGLDCAVKGDTESAIGAADLALEAFEAYVDATEGEGSVYDDAVITSSVVYREELRRRREDLETLARIREVDPRVVDELCQRSRESGFAAIVASRR